MTTIEKIVSPAKPSAAVPPSLCPPRHTQPPYTTIICLQGHTSGMHHSIAVQRDDESKSFQVDNDHDFALQCLDHGFAALCLELRDAGLAYVAWATERPERTRLMMGGMMKVDPLCTCLHAAAEEAFGWIFRIIDGGRAAGVFGGPDTHSVVISAWSAVHGLAMLILNSGKMNARGPDEVRHLAEVVCETIADGIRARPERPRPLCRGHMHSEAP